MALSMDKTDRRCFRWKSLTMHNTAMMYGEAFFNTYIGTSSELTIIDIGSQDVNGSLRSVAPPNNKYIGIDFTQAKGVDIVIDDPYSLPFEDESIDVIVSSSCFEHSEFFWLLFNEALRVLKPTGILYINAPSNGIYHRYPLDCWRFYPDSGIALQNWGRRSGYDCVLLESFIGIRDVANFNDFVAVFLKQEKNQSKYTNRIQSKITGFTYSHQYKTEHVLNFQPTAMK